MKYNSKYLIPLAIILILVLVYFIIEVQTKSNLIINQDEEIENLKWQLGAVDNWRSQLEDVENELEAKDKLLQQTNGELASKERYLKQIEKKLILYDAELLPLSYLSQEQLNINISEAHASEDFMPCAGFCNYRKHIIILVEMENNAGFDLKDLHIPRVDIIQNNQIVGNFVPSFEIIEDCSGTAVEKLVDEINLSSGCKFKFNARTHFFDEDRIYEDLPDFTGSIKMKFRFADDNYYTDIYETNEIDILSTH